MGSHGNGADGSVEGASSSVRPADRGPSEIVSPGAVGVRHGGPTAPKASDMMPGMLAASGLVGEPPSRHFTLSRDVEMGVERGWR